MLISVDSAKAWINFNAYSSQRIDIRLQIKGKLLELIKDNYWKPKANITLN